VRARVGDAVRHVGCALQQGVVDAEARRLEDTVHVRNRVAERQHAVAGFAPRQRVHESLIFLLQ
jgi:hypothetical protein